MAKQNGATGSHDIEVTDLSYKFQDGSLGLTGINLDLPAGSRTLLIGGMYQTPNVGQEMSLPSYK